MRRASLFGVPAFLQYLSTFPPPDAVLASLLLGPLQKLGAVAAMLWEVRDGHLVRTGGYAHTRAELDRYALLPLDIDFVVSTAVRDRVRIVSNDPLPGSSPAATLDAEFWNRMLDRVGAVAVVRAPVVYRGRPVGAIGILFDRPVDDQSVSIDVVDSTVSAIALWMTHPRTRAPRPVAPGRSTSFALTPRQREILRMVEHGLPNRAIAARLRLSESSVKQDLQRAMRSLRVDGRHLAALRARELGLLRDEEQ